jgi:tripartite-type tricarboxylate transporter receptor subunit TctC
MLNRVLLLLALGCLCIGQTPARAQPAWPDHPIRIVVVFPPGGSSDIVARVLAEAMGPKLGQRVVVDNRPGAGGTLAALHVAQQPADGYTLMLSNNAPITTSPPIYPNVGYDPVRSFTHISYIGITPLVVLGNLGVPAHNMAELQAWMRAQPQPVAFGSSGAGSVGHVVGTLFSQQTGIPLNHVPYRGSTPMQADLLGGSILVAFDPLPDNSENIRAGRVRAFAVTADQRQPSLPDVPTTAEVALPNLVVGNWLGLSGPAGLPPAIVARLHAEVAAAMQTSLMRERLATVGIVGGQMTQAEFAAFVAKDVREVGGAVRAMGITAN